MKDGIDTFDQMCKNYTTSGIIKRWPVNMLDQAGTNILLNLRATNSITPYFF